ncbi:MAG: imidazoleglycerol-phosphate dehydratase HisB [Balneolales bacterium]
MKIRIDTDALVPFNNDHIFREHALTALIRFKDNGHEINFHGKELNVDQLSLLAQESITAHEFEDMEADSKVTTNGEDLLLTVRSWKDYKKMENWDEVTNTVLNTSRTAETKRTTNETDISVKLNIDGTGKSNISTGLGFFDHMLDQIAKHGFIDLEIQCKGDLQVDEHHTIEDVALAFGETLSEAIGDKRGIGRYGFVLPMDESQAIVALDLSGRPYLVYEASFTRDMVGDFPTEMVKHFFYSFAMALQATLQIEVKGENDHHKIESMFKGLAKSLRQALDKNEKYLNVLPSSKGKL